MALTMLDKAAEKKDKSQWPAEIAAEFERGGQNPNPAWAPRCCRRPSARAYGSSASRWRAHRLHRHVLDYFWTAVSGGRGRQHVHDGTTVEYTQPGETRHESYAPAHSKVHDLENLAIAK